MENMEFIGIVAAVIVIVLALVLTVKLLSAPLRLAAKFLINALVGFAVLFLLNFAEGFTGLSLGINWGNAVVVGFLGAPGVVLLLLLKYFL